MREVGRLVPVSDYVLPAAEKVIAECSPGADRDNFEHRVTALSTLWVNVRMRTTDRQHVIEHVFPAAQNYDDACKDMTDWLKEAEHKFINLHPVPCDMESVNQQRANLKVLGSNNLKQIFITTFCVPTY